MVVVVEWAVKPVAWRRRQVEVGCYTWRTSCTPHWRVRLVSAPDELMRRHRQAFFVATLALFQLNGTTEEAKN